MKNSIPLPQEPSITVTQLGMALNLAGVNKSGLMEVCTRVNGAIIVQMERASSGTLMVTCMKVIGKMTRLTVMDFINMLMAPVTLENGEKTSKMATV